MQHNAPHCNTLAPTSLHDDYTLHHTATHCTSLQHTAPHCNTLQHTATHCNTLQHTWPTSLHDDREIIIQCIVQVKGHCDVCCSMLQYVAVCCSVLQRFKRLSYRVSSRSNVTVMSVAACCSVLQCVAVCCSVSQNVAVQGDYHTEYHPSQTSLSSVLQRVAVCCRVLQCVAVCCSVL